MIPIQNAKVVTLYDGSLATNNSTAYTVAMAGYRSCTMIVQWDKASATNSSVTATSATFAAGDSTSLGTSVLTGTTGTPTASQYVLPINNDTSLYTQIVANFRNDTGYSHIGVTPVPSSTSFKIFTVTAILSEAEEGPIASSTTSRTKSLAI